MLLLFGLFLKEAKGTVYATIKYQQQIKPDANPQKLERQQKNLNNLCHIRAEKF